MNFSYRSFSYFLFFALNFGQLTWSSAQEDIPVSINVHNVGQGNCVILRAYDEFMIVDAGSSAHQDELFYMHKQPLVSELEVPMAHLSFTENEIVTGRSPSMSPIKDTEKSKNSMESGIFSPDYDVTVNVSQQEWIDESEEETEDIAVPQSREELAEYIRPSLRTSNNQTLHVRTAVVTHPDSDHYNLFEPLIRENDKLEHLVLVGLPNLYLKPYTPLSEEQKSSKDFNRWVVTRIKKGTKLYFPTLNLDNQMNRAKIKLTENGVITLQDMKNPSGEVEEEKIASIWKALLNLLPDNKCYSLAPNVTTFASQPYENAFAFKNVTITPLALNPVHHEIQSINKQHSTILRTILPDDTNSDSLVLKISYGASSIILPGDATSLTTERIEANYKGSLDFLKATVLLASHHGAESDGSNNASWIGLTQPEYVLISNGHTYGHPRKSAYEAFKTSPHLKIVGRHKVLVGDNPRGKNKDEGMNADWDEEEEDKNKEKRTSTGELHATNRAIFSTLNSGTLTVALFQDGNVKLRTEIDGNIIALGKQDKNKEEEDKNASVEEEKSEDDTIEEVEIKTTPQKVILKKKGFIGIRELKALNIYHNKKKLL